MDDSRSAGFAEIAVQKMARCCWTSDSVLVYEMTGFKRTPCGGKDTPQDKGLNMSSEGMDLDTHMDKEENLCNRCNEFHLIQVII